MGVADMGPDAAPDSGNNNVNNVNNSNNVNNINNVNNVNNVNNANNVNNNNGNGGDEDGGCCATQRAADSSVVVWCLFALIALRRRRVTSRA